MHVHTTHNFVQLSNIDPHVTACYTRGSCWNKNITRPPISPNKAPYTTTQAL